MKLTLLPTKQSLDSSPISISLEMVTLKPNSTVYKHLKSLISQTLMIPQSSVDTTIGLYSIQVIALTIELCPCNYPT